MPENNRNSTMEIHLISNNKDRFSQVTKGRILATELMQRVFHVEHQTLFPLTEKEAHNAAPDSQGAITHILIMAFGSVKIGIGQELKKQYFGPGSILCFTDQEGLGHSSIVGASGCDRIYMQARGHIRTSHLLPLLEEDEKE